MFNTKTLKATCAILGILAIVFAIIIFTMGVGSYESNEYYGGDAYTGIQQAAAQTANNVQAVGKMLRLGIGSIVMLHGLVLLLGALCIKTPANTPMVLNLETSANVTASTYAVAINEEETHKTHSDTTTAIGNK